MAFGISDELLRLHEGQKQLELVHLCPRMNDYTCQIETQTIRFSRAITPHKSKSVKNISMTDKFSH
jgi:hypothetical protein